MPVTYPPPPATLSGDLLTIHRLLQSPALIGRRLNSMANLRFIADRLLWQRYRSAGGAVSYEQGQPLFTDREIQAVAPGSEYPRAQPQLGQAVLAEVRKWGQATRITDEKIKRSIPMGDAIDNALRIVVNTVIRKIDRLAIAAIADAVTATMAAGAPWNESTATILRDIEYAKAAIEDLEMGWSPNMILMTTTTYANMISDDKIATLRRRETSDNPVYGGEIETIAGLEVVTTPIGNMPGQIDQVWVMDSRNLGGMADETEVDPGYAMSRNNVQVQTERIANADAWDMWARRITVPFVTEPSAAIRITGTAGS